MRGSGRYLHSEIIIMYVWMPVNVASPRYQRNYWSFTPRACMHREKRVSQIMKPGSLSTVYADTTKLATPTEIYIYFCVGKQA